MMAAISTRRNFAEVRDLVCMDIGLPAVHGASMIGCHDDAVVDLYEDSNGHGTTPPTGVRRSIGIPAACGG